MNDQAEHYRQLFERADREAKLHKALLFDAWRTMAGQTKGLQRQRRLIRRLQAEAASPWRSSEDIRQGANRRKLPAIPPEFTDGLAP